MKHNQSKTSPQRARRLIPLAILAAMTAMVGCEWDNPLYDEFVNEKASKGEQLSVCPGVSKIVFSDGAEISSDGSVNLTYAPGVSEDDVKKRVDYQKAFENKACPTLAPNCVTHKDKVSCNTCQEGQSLCMGKCVALDTFTFHISNCDDNVLTCKAGYADCDGDVANGCEYNLTSTHVDI